MPACCASTVSRVPRRPRLANTTWCDGNSSVCPRACSAPRVRRSKSRESCCSSTPMLRRPKIASELSITCGLRLRIGGASRGSAMPATVSSLDRLVKVAYYSPPPRAPRRENPTLMHFGLTEEQSLLQETVRGFVAGECPAPRLRELFDAGAGHDPALWKGLAEIGIAGLTVPEPLGGADLGLLELALVMEELGAGALPAPSFGHALACLAIQLAGSEAHRERWLPDLASGARIATIAFAEPNAAWDPERWSLALENDR